MYVSDPEEARDLNRVSVAGDAKQVEISCRITPTAGQGLHNLIYQFKYSIRNGSMCPRPCVLRMLHKIMKEMTKEVRAQMLSSQLG